MPSLKLLRTRKAAWLVTVTALVATTLYPSDIKGHYAMSRNGHDNALIVGVEDYGRHLNTIIPIGTAILLRDVKGLGQIAAIVCAGTAATHAPKRLLDDIEVFGTRLGRRPNGGDHNMPSGHSALASAGAYVAVRRYTKWFGLIVWPVTLLTMYARYMLDAHTVSATIAGAIVGLMIAAAITHPFFGFKRLIAIRLNLRPRRAVRRSLPAQT